MVSAGNCRMLSSSARTARKIDSGSGFKVWGFQQPPCHHQPSVTIAVYLALSLSNTHTHTHSRSLSRSFSPSLSFFLALSLAEMALRALGLGSKEVQPDLSSSARTARAPPSISHFESQISNLKGSRNSKF